MEKMRRELEERHGEARKHLSTLSTRILASEVDRCSIPKPTYKLAQSGTRSHVEPGEVGRRASLCSPRQRVETRADR